MDGGEKHNCKHREQCEEKHRMGLGMGHTHNCLEGQIAGNFEFSMSDHGHVVFVVHFSDGRVKYTLNKNSVKIEIPLPFGGKSSKELKMSETIQTPDLNFKSIGFYLKFAYIISTCLFICQSVSTSSSWEEG